MHIEDEFYNEALITENVFTFSKDGDFSSEPIGEGGLVVLFYFWSSAARALSYREQKQKFSNSDLIKISLEEFCKKTIESLRGRAHIVTVALNAPGEPGASILNLGIDGVHGYLDRFRLDKPKKNWWEVWR